MLPFSLLGIIWATQWLKSMSAWSPKYYSLNIVNYVINTELVKFKNEVVLGLFQRGEESANISGIWYITACRTFAAEWHFFCFHYEKTCFIFILFLCVENLSYKTYLNKIHSHCKRRSKWLVQFLGIIRTIGVNLYDFKEFNIL